jgi:hypothetical protein
MEEIIKKGRDQKLDGPVTYLSWSRRIEAALVGKRLDRNLT